MIVPPFEAITIETRAGKHYLSGDRWPRETLVAAEVLEVGKPTIEVLHEDDGCLAMKILVVNGNAVYDLEPADDNGIHVAKLRYGILR